jgi:hypothetical protein
VTKEKEEQPQAAETMEDVENVTEADLKDVDEHLKTQMASPTSQIIKDALKDQSGLRTLVEIISDLSKPLAPRHLKKLTKGPAAGSTYIPWPVIGKYLDFYAPGWEMRHTIVSDPYGNNVTTEITIPTSDFGKVTRAGVGFEPHVTNKGTDKEKLTGFGGSAPIASRMSSKRSAAEFGLGKYLYKS